MRKHLKLFTILLLTLTLFIMVGCGGNKQQGVTKTEILVGNTAATSGGYAQIGVPFNDAMLAVFKEINDAGGIDGRKIKFITYNDEFDASKGITYTEKLVEEDKIFALVGHFGTPTVGATLDYIQEKGIPMVYAATGINGLYFEKSEGNPILAVQPIYKTDGRLMAARAVKEKVYGANKDAALPANAKIGVIYTNDDAGKSIKEGVEDQLKALNLNNNAIYEQVSDNYSSAINKFKTENVSVVIIAANQIPFAGILTQMADSELYVPVFSSYVNADVTAVPERIKDGTAPIDIYVNAWVDVFSTKGAQDVQDFVATINNSDLSQEKKTQYLTNSFAIAGYIAARVFVEGLKRVAEKGEELTWENYIKAMESAPIDIPMGGTVDFTGGKRWGIASMSLLKYTPASGQIPESFAKVREIETIEDILKK